MVAEEGDGGAIAHRIRAGVSARMKLPLFEGTPMGGLDSLDSVLEEGVKLGVASRPQILAITVAEGSVYGVAQTNTQTRWFRWLMAALKLLSAPKYREISGALDATVMVRCRVPMGGLKDVSMDELESQIEDLTKRHSIAPYITSKKEALWPHPKKGKGFLFQMQSTHLQRRAEEIRLQEDDGDTVAEGEFACLQSARKGK